MLKKRPNHFDALHMLGLCEHHSGNAEAAARLLWRALLLDVRAFANRGAAYKELRQADEALADFDRALALAPDHAATWINRGEVLIYLRRHEEAIANFDRALSINPELADAWVGRANVLMSSNVTEALSACQRALAIRPNSAGAVSLLGQWHAKQGDAEAAVSCFDRALAIKPDDEGTLSNRIFSLDFCKAAGFAEHQAARSEWWRQIGSKIAAVRRLPCDHDRNPERRLVLGYVSAEFKQRSAAYSFVKWLCDLRRSEQDQQDIRCRHRRLV